MTRSTAPASLRSDDPVIRYGPSAAPAVAHRPGNPVPTSHPQPVVRSNGPGTGNHSAALACPQCGTDDVTLHAIQTALVDGDGPVNNVTVWLAGRLAGRVITHDTTPTPGRDAAGNRRPRTAQTFTCRRGHAWAIVTATPPQGRTTTYRTTPTLPL